MIGRLRFLSLATAALVLAVIAFAAIAPARDTQAQGTTKTVTTELEPFTSIRIDGGGSATLTFGDAPSVTVTGNSLILDQIETRVVGDQLVLGSLLTSALDITGLSELTYEIVAPAVEEIHLAGTVTLDVPAMPAVPFLEIGLTTGANLNISAMAVASLTGKLDLLSKASLAGSADTMQLEINNGSELDAANLQVGSADLVLNGLSKATVRVTDSLTGRASQGSTVNYISETVEPNITLSTLANINQLPYTEWTGPAPVASPEP